MAGLVEEADAKLLEQGHKVLPHKCSVGWAYSVKKRQELLSQKVNNTEDLCLPLNHIVIWVSSSPQKA